jgi:LPS-assembly protein
VRTLAPLIALLLLPVAAEAARYEPERWVQCRQGPLFDFQRSDLGSPAERATAPADVSARVFEVREETVYHLEGEVELLRADQWLGAGRMRYDHESGRFLAEGEVRYQDADLLFRADRIEGELQQDRSELSNVRYQLVAVRGNGEASQVLREGERSRLDDFSFTTCDPDKRSWLLTAAQADLDHAEGIGRARDIRLRIGDLPVAWLPYATFPIDDRRRTGLLYPRIGYDGRNGIDYSQPFYWNLAPHYDATLTPRILGRRGAMLGVEFRYLGQSSRGQLEGDYLPGDKLRNRDRGSLSWRHSTTFNRNWQARANINHVSDKRYFEDFGDSLAATSTTLLGSQAGVHGRGRGWSASFAVESWDLVDPLVDDRFEPFRRLPRARFDLERGLGGQLVYGLRSEAVVFDHDDRPGATRIDLHPYLALPYIRSAGFLRPEIGLRHTRYRLESGFGSSYTERNPSRSTPILSLDGGLFFDRSANLFGRGFTQTLEPRLYYLRVPFEDQSDIPVFDSRELTFSMAQLFRSNRFAGADRQADANQLAVALGTRLIEDASGRERLSASIGQVRYFGDLRVQLPGVPVDTRSGSAYVGDVSFSPNDTWTFSAGQQWDPETDSTQLSSLRAQARLAGGRLFNASYRYRNGAIEQVDASAILPLREGLRMVARWNYSLRDRSSIEAFAGFEWEDCCIAWRVLGRHYVRNREGERSNALYVELELKGLGSFGRRTDELLERAILGYTR